VLCCERWRGFNAAVAKLLWSLVCIHVSDILLGCCLLRVLGIDRYSAVLTDPFTSPTGPFLSEWAKCQPGNTQNGRTVLPIANLMADSELGSPVSCSSFLVTICLSRLVLEIFECDGQTGR